MQTYSPNDLSAFERLLEFDGETDPATRAGADDGRRDQRPSARYMPADMARFDELMNFESAGGHVGSTQTGFVSAASGETGAPASAETLRYSDADLRQFSRILGSPSTEEIVGEEEAMSGRPSLPAARQPAYSRRDLETFERLLSIGDVGEPQPRESEVARAAREFEYKASDEAARSIGTMKIIDSDKEREREKDALSRGVGAIKIVFSDAGGRVP